MCVCAGACRLGETPQTSIDLQHGVQKGVCASLFFVVSVLRPKRKLKRLFGNHMSMHIGIFLVRCRGDAVASSCTAAAAAAAVMGICHYVVNGILYVV